jgi:hypothetical protein
VSTVSRLHQRGPFVARQIDRKQVSSKSGVQYGAGLPAGVVLPAGFFFARRFPDAPARRCRNGSLAAPKLFRGWAGPRVHQKGELSRVVHALSFARLQPVTQPVIPLNFQTGAAVETHPLQGEFPLFARMNGPSVVAPEIMRTAKTYRQAVRLCWQLRRVRNMTYRQLATEAGLHFQHVTDYFNADDKPSRRDLPGQHVRAVETALGNTAISQWHAAQAALTVLEEMQASRRAA